MSVLWCNTWSRGRSLFVRPPFSCLSVLHLSLERSHCFDFLFKLPSYEYNFSAVVFATLVILLCSVFSRVFLCCVVCISGSFSLCSFSFWSFCSGQLFFVLCFLFPPWCFLLAIFNVVFYSWLMEVFYLQYSLDRVSVWCCPLCFCAAMKHTFVLKMCVE